jgi:hypothetical protein
MRKRRLWSSLLTPSREGLSHGFRVRRFDGLENSEGVFGVRGGLISPAERFEGEGHIRADGIQYRLRPVLPEQSGEGLSNNVGIRRLDGSENLKGAFAMRDGLVSLAEQGECES